MSAPSALPAALPVAAHAAVSPARQGAATAAIGLYDSGVGGLSVLSQVRQHLPAEDLIYVADNAYVPYGEKPTSTIEARACAIADQLLARGVKALGVACNTATAAAIETLRRRHPGLPIIGIEPAVKPAAALTRSGVIGVLATSGTLASPRFVQLMQREAPQARVLLRPCPEWVALVERGDFDAPRHHDTLAAPVHALLAEGADVLVLGCTHFPFLLPRLRQIAGPDVTILETGSAFARQLQRRLDEAGLLNPRRDTVGATQWLASGDTAGFERHVEALLHQRADCQRLPA